MGRRTQKTNNSIKKIIIVLIVAILILGIMFLVKYLTNNNGESQNDLIGILQDKNEEVKKLQIVDEESKSRPYAVMINNNHAAWPQCGIQDAYLVY